MPAVVVGRDAELAVLDDFVGGISDGCHALVLEGEAGMGKTTLWRVAVEHAEDVGVLVLQAQPVESETTLSYAGIGDLFEPVLDATLEALPAVQRRALSRALVLGEEDDAPLDPRALRVALMTALRTLAEDRPVLVAIDDSQWLDYASSAGLAYGARRFRAERIGLLLSRRSGLESVLLDELLRSPAGERFTRVGVGALDVQALGRVVHEQLGATLPRPLLAEIHGAAGGNPFYALEIGRALQRTGTSIEAGHPIPLPESLHELVAGRLLALPSDSRVFLLAAAAYAHPTIAITEAASGVERAAGLAPALEAHVVELDRDRIRFTHPLLAAGAYESGDALRRHDIDVRLAELLDDPEARAWQLAAATTSTDEGVAAILEDAALRARTRGAMRPGALLLERAAELTPADSESDIQRRRVAAAYAHHAAGDTERARLLLEPALEKTPMGPSEPGSSLRSPASARTTTTCEARASSTVRRSSRRPLDPRSRRMRKKGSVARSSVCASGWTRQYAPREPLPRPQTGSASRSSRPRDSRRRRLQRPRLAGSKLPRRPRRRFFCSAAAQIVRFCASRCSRLRWFVSGTTSS